ncbi:hypothetical protein KACHI17_10240 [Sediminibacterium sp. KACHI17]|uniref:DUF3899 domain-containing protein n=1 Tax=Sediminibacterium sp. KACHI17 TaxID=1751071 RepID=A0AAT9GHP9_9BACT
MNNQNDLGQEERNNEIENNILKYQSDFYEASSEVSKISRNLVFAVLGILLIFRNLESNAGPFIPKELNWPLILIVIFIVLDLAHYIFRTFSILHFYTRKKNKYNKEVETKKISDVNYPDYPKYIPLISWVLFIMKISCSLISFILVIIFLVPKLF